MGTGSRRAALWIVVVAATGVGVVVAARDAGEVAQSGDVGGDATGEDGRRRARAQPDGTDGMSPPTSGAAEAPPRRAAEGSLAARAARLAEIAALDGEGRVERLLGLLFDEDPAVAQAAGVALAAKHPEALGRVMSELRGRGFDGGRGVVEFLSRTGPAGRRAVVELICADLESADAEITRDVGLDVALLLGPDAADIAPEIARCVVAGAPDGDVRRPIDALMAIGAAGWDALDAAIGRAEPDAAAWIIHHLGLPPGAELEPSVEFLLRRLRTDEAAVVRDAAIGALMHCGKDLRDGSALAAEVDAAVLRYAAAAQEPGGRLRDAAIEYVASAVAPGTAGRLALLTAAIEEDLAPRVRSAVLRGLRTEADLGDEQFAAILRREFADPERREAVVMSLGVGGPRVSAVRAALPDVIPWIPSLSPEARWYLFRLLGEELRDALPLAQLVAGIRDAEECVSEAAAAALYRWRSEAAPAYGDLLDVAAHGNATSAAGALRAAAATGLADARLVALLRARTLEDAEGRTDWRLIVAWVEAALTYDGAREQLMALLADDAIRERVSSGIGLEQVPASPRLMSLILDLWDAGLDRAELPAGLLTRPGVLEVVEARLASAPKSDRRRIFSAVAASRCAKEDARDLAVAHLADADPAVRAQAYAILASDVRAPREAIVAALRDVGGIVSPRLSTNAAVLILSDTEAVAQALPTLRTWYGSPDSERDRIGWAALVLARDEAVWPQLVASARTQGKAYGLGLWGGAAAPTAVAALAEAPSAHRVEIASGFLQGWRSRAMRRPAEQFLADAPAPPDLLVLVAAAGGASAASRTPADVLRAGLAGASDEGEFGAALALALDPKLLPRDEIRAALAPAWDAPALALVFALVRSGPLTTEDRVALEALTARRAVHVREAAELALAGKLR